MGWILLYVFELQESNFLVAFLFHMQEDPFMSLINVTNLTFAYDGSYDKIFEKMVLEIPDPK